MFIVFETQRLRWVALAAGLRLSHLRRTLHYSNSLLLLELRCAALVLFTQALPSSSRSAHPLAFFCSIPSISSTSLISLSR